MNLGRPSLVSTFALALALAACSEGDSDTSPSDAAALVDGGAPADAVATGADASPASDAAPVSPDAAPVSPDAAPAMVAGAVSLTINGQPATLAPALMVVPRGLPNVNVTSFKIIAGQGPAANDNAVATLEIFGKMGGLNPGFTQSDVTATVTVDLYHPTHQRIVNYTTGRIGLKPLELVLDSTGGRVKGTATQKGRPWAGVGLVNGAEDDVVVFTFDVPYPSPPQR